MANGPGPDLLEQPEYVKDWLLTALLPVKLGNGATRHVYALDHNPDLVIKIENSKADFCNVHEWETWHEVRGTKWEKYFAPCVGIKGHGTLLLMKRTQPITEEEFRAEVKQLPSFMDDCHYANFGRLDGRIVCHDYGYSLIYEQARRLARLKKAPHQ